MTAPSTLARYLDECLTPAEVAEALRPDATYEVTYHTCPGSSRTAVIEVEAASPAAAAALVGCPVYRVRQVSK